MNYRFHGTDGKINKISAVDINDTQEENDAFLRSVPKNRLSCQTKKSQHFQKLITDVLKKNAMSASGLHIYQGYLIWQRGG